MIDPQTATAVSRSSRKWLIGGVAVVALGAIAVLFVLPAEFGVDPTGAGRALGLTKMAKPQESEETRRGKLRTNVLFALAPSTEPGEPALRSALTERGIALPADAQLRSDRFTVELLPFEGIEMKYELARGAPMVFRWRASAPVNYDLHAHPYEGGTELTESYALSDAPAQAALYVAPFTGIHGWYWQNQTLDPVTVTVDAMGAITKSFTFDQAGEHPRALTPPSTQEPAATTP
jgi:hypothetical protein